jgi:hypothetical protein
MKLYTTLAMAFLLGTPAILTARNEVLPPPPYVGGGGIGDEDPWSPFGGGSGGDGGSGWWNDPGFWGWGSGWWRYPDPHPPGDGGGNEGGGNGEGDGNICEDGFPTRSFQYCSVIVTGGPGGYANRCACFELDVTHKTSTGVQELIAVCWRCDIDEDRPTANCASAGVGYVCD